jgi:hypothetical protein
MAGFPKDGNVEAVTTTQSVGDIDIVRLQTEIKNIYSNLSQLEQEEGVILHSKTDQIRHLASNYEKLYYKGVYKKALNFICETICDELTRRNLGRSTWLARKVLDQKYKQMQYAVGTGARNSDHAELTRDANGIRTAPGSSIPLESVPADVTQYQQDNYIQTTGTSTQDQDPYYWANHTSADYFAEMTPTYQEPNADVQMDYWLKQNKSTDHMSKEQFRDHTEKTMDMLRKVTEVQRELRRRSKENLERCLNEKIALSPGYEQADSDHVGTVYGKTGISLAWEKIEQYKKILDKVQDKLYYFKPPPKIAKKMADALDEEIEFWRPMADEKFRKDMMSWWITELDNIWYGKHAAGQINATILPDKTKRALTREQIGDRSEETLQRALRFAAAQRWRVEFQFWYIQEVEPRIAARAKELHGKLSEQSFG